MFVIKLLTDCDNQAVSPAVNVPGFKIVCRKIVSTNVGVGVLKQWVKQFKSLLNTYT